MSDELAVPADATGDQSNVSLEGAVNTAKQWLTSTLYQEKIENIGLEEASRVGADWLITLGFSRPWDATRDAISVLGGGVVLRRTYKVLTVDGRSGEILSMKNKD